MIQEIIAKEGYLHIPDFFEVEDSEALEQQLENFTYSLLSLDLEERLEVSLLVSNYFKKNLQEKLTGFKFITGSFLIKPPNDQSTLALHQDWSYVLQDKFPIYTCWSPLLDTNKQSGSLFFVKGSHLFFDNLRSKEYETARITELDQFGDRLQSIAIKKGDLVLFDPRVFHGSHPNMQNIQRTAITCLATPQEAEIMYFSKQDENSCQPIKIGDEGIERYLEQLVSGAIPKQLEKAPIITYLHQVPEVKELLLKSKN